MLQGMFPPFWLVAGADQGRVEGLAKDALLFYEGTGFKVHSVESPLMTQTKILIWSHNTKCVRAHMLHASSCNPTSSATIANQSGILN